MAVKQVSVAGGGEKYLKYHKMQEASVSSGVAASARHKQTQMIFFVWHCSVKQPPSNHPHPNFPPVNACAEESVWAGSLKTQPKYASRCRSCRGFFAHTGWKSQLWMTLKKES